MLYRKISLWDKSNTYLYFITMTNVPLNKHSTQKTLDVNCMEEQWCLTDLEWSVVSVLFVNKHIDGALWPQTVPHLLSWARGCWARRMNLVFRKLCSIASPGNEFKSGTVDKTVWTIEDRGTAVGDMVGRKMRSYMIGSDRGLCSTARYNRGTLHLPRHIKVSWNSHEILNVCNGFVVT